MFIVAPIMLVPISAFAFKDGVLCRLGTVAKATVTQLVIPTSPVGIVLQLLHDILTAGYPGCDKTLSMARKKYYWLTMRLDDEQPIAQCLSCAEHKGTTLAAPIFEYSLPAEPLLTLLVSTFCSCHAVLRALLTSSCVSTTSAVS